MNQYKDFDWIRQLFLIDFSIFHKIIVLFMGH